MRNFIVYKEEVAGDNGNDWSLKMCQSESLLTLLKELNASDWDYKTEEEAIENMSTVEGGYNCL